MKTPSQFEKGTVEKFFAGIFFEPNTGCWLHINDGPKGYSRATLDGKRNYGHIISYELHKGPVPEGLQIDHTCKVKCCVNPDHLEAVTSGENTRRGPCGKKETNPGGKYWAAKTHCNKGHPLSGENLIVHPNGWRSCRECRRRSALDHYHRTKGR